MQLKEYWRIIRRRWPLVLLIPAVTFAASTYLAYRGPGAFCSYTKLAVSVLPDPTYVSDHYDPRYYATLVAEYLADDLTEVMKSQAFAVDVSAELGNSIEPAFVASAVRAKKTHRTIDLEVCGQDPGVVKEVGEAYGRVLDTRLDHYFQQIRLADARALVLNPPTIARSQGIGSMAATIGLRTLLGLALGLGLAFLLHYLDDRLRDRDEVERLLDLPTLAEIPRHQPVLVR